MKPFNGIPDYRPKSERNKDEEFKIKLEPCCLCGKPITDGYFGRWGNGGTCSKKCESIMEEKPKDFGEPK